jgi:hypothetical protein
MSLTAELVDRISQQDGWKQELLENLNTDLNPQELMGWLH